jgi:hypothetical protein
MIGGELFIGAQDETRAGCLVYTSGEVDKIQRSFAAQLQTMDSPRLIVVTCTVRPGRGGGRSSSLGLQLQSSWSRLVQLAPVVRLACK